MSFGRLLCELTAGALLLSACSSEPHTADGRDWNAWPWMTVRMPPHVQLSAKLLASDTAANLFQGILTFRNAGSDTAHVEFGACSFGMRLYRDASLQGSPIWDNRPPPNTACILVGYAVTLGPGEQRDRVVGLATRSAVRGVAPGQYAAAIAWRSSDKAPIRIVAAGPAGIQPR